MKTDKKWKRISDKPLLSKRVLIAMHQFGLSGRHMSTGTYWHLEDRWDIDDEEMRIFTPSHWMDLPRMAYDFEQPNN